MQTLEEITRKINKLLKLANGGSEEEAKSAMEKALQLASENSLDLETAAIMGETVTAATNEPVEEKTADGCGKLKITDRFVLNILERHFNVKILYGTRNRSTTIFYVGTDSNIKLAKEIYERLTEIFQYNWLSYKNRTNTAVENKRAYFDGMTTGICETLERTRKKMVERYVGLLPEAVNKESAANRYEIVLSTPQKRNQDFIDAKYKKLRSRHFSSFGYNYDVRSDGIADGRSVDVEGNRKAIMA